MINIDMSTLETLVTTQSNDSLDVYGKLQILARAYQDNPNPETRAAYQEYKAITFPIRYGVCKWTTRILHQP